jgi:hypothetical protein
MGIDYELIVEQQLTRAFGTSSVVFNQVMMEEIVRSRYS